ncbi:hypothetical protein MUP59_03680 [Candidatus Bathyarchaeota archaeon]|nr:hypothetical protein [Candidatus Bathyarchaeota archaeon]
MTQLQKDQNESTENMKVDIKRNLVDRWGQIVFGLFLILLFVILYVIARECKFDQDPYDMVGPIMLILLVGAVVFVLANLFKPMMTKEDKETSEKNNRKPCDNDDKLQVLLCQYSEAFTCEREYNK